MAGGMGRSNRETLARRTANTRAAAEPRPPLDPTPDTPQTRLVPPVRHCWIDSPHGRLPALLLGWEQRAGAWHGRVVHPVEDADGWVVVEQWVSAALLQPAET